MLALGLAGVPLATGASPLRFCFEDASQAPWTEPDGSGLALDLLRTAAARLHVVGAGHEHAIAVWGPLGLEGREVWHWKDRRDRRQLAALFAL